jgi:hypothetical protein
MNKRQVIILWVTAIILGVIVTIVKLNQSDTTRSATNRAPGETLFESFPANDAAEIEIQDAKARFHLAKKDGKWVISERNGYPANTNYVFDFLRTLGELKVTMGTEAGPSFAPRFGMDDAAEKPEEHGLTATFKDASGKEIAKVSLGKNITGGDQSSMMSGGAVGRYVRNHADESGFYSVSEMFPSVNADPKHWLADGFISPEKVKSISVTLPGKSDIAWKVVRDGEEAEFKFDGAAATEVLDSGSGSPLKSILSYSSFEDVVPPDKVADKAEEGQKRTVTIQTFEGFTYTITLTPTKLAASATPPADGEPPAATDNFLMTVDVAAELPKERKKEEGEKPEDAKTKDTAFTDRLKSLTEKLEKEKAFTGITFEVGNSTLAALLKDKAAMVAKPADPAAANPPVQKFPGGMVARPPVTATTPPLEAVTPPISIPAQEEETDGSEDGP